MIGLTTKQNYAVGFLFMAQSHKGVHVLNLLLLVVVLLVAALINQ